MEKKNIKKQYIFIYSMLIIAFIGITKYFWVSIKSILIAFSVENELGEQISSLDNFKRLFAEFADPNSGIWTYLINTLKYFVLYLFKICVSFCVAFFLFKKVMAYKFFRIVFYLPCIISPIILATIFKNILLDNGIIAKVAFDMGVEYTNPLTTVEGATPTILFYCFWSGFGTSLLIFVGAMNRIPTSIIESAQLDGCKLGREFFSIVTPLVWGSFSTMVLLTLTGIFTATGPILYFTAGGQKTSSISFWIFYETYNGSYNYPSAVGLFFTVVGLPIVFGGRWLMNKVDTNVSY